MCCFSRVIAEVADTNVFARATVGDRQVIAYQMHVRALADEEPLAMILPLPVPPGTAPNADANAVRFIDLSAYPTFFADLRKPFAGAPSATRAGGGAAVATLPAPRLVVHRTGSFEASFVPSVADFARLDERFRLPADAWRALPRYADWGFAVFKLRDVLASAATVVEPIAFEFRRRDAGVLFFPTVHIHDGRVHARASFDHNLFFQTAPDEEVIVSIGGYARAAGSSFQPARQHCSPLQARGILDEELPIQVVRLTGELPNHDATIALLPRALDPQLAELAAWMDAPFAMPAERAIALVRRLIDARLTDDATVAVTTAGAAIVAILPRARERLPSLWSGDVTFWAPEICQGLTDVDERADVYALAVLLHSLASGQRLFGASEGVAVLVAHLQTPPPPLAEPTLDAIVKRGLAKDRVQRFSSLRELDAALAG